MTEAGFIADSLLAVGPTRDANLQGAGTAEIELRMLELRHRIKNIMGIVQSLVNQTLRDGVLIAEAREVLTGRLIAISHAVDLLLSGAWEAAPLSSLIRSAMTMGTDRIRLDGPPVEVGPSSAMMLSILFHELECNAIKYGSLSAERGSVEVSWAIEGDGDQRVALTWTETGGPKVAAPAQEGFGSKLISRIASRFDGEAAPEFNPEGLCWRLSAPLASLRS